ncbi:GNAT family N-acetyltransferase [Candidatus Pyrohabitans sp.]
MLEVLVSGHTREYLYWSTAEVIARAVVVEYPEKAEIKLINVARHRRGEGIGSMLLERIVSDFLHKELFTWTFNGRSSWYERRGFTVDEERASLLKMVRRAKPSEGERS